MKRSEWTIFIIVMLVGVISGGIILDRYTSIFKDIGNFFKTIYETMKSWFW